MLIKGLNVCAIHGRCKGNIGQALEGHTFLGMKVHGPVELGVHVRHTCTMGGIGGGHTFLESCIPFTPVLGC